jgi:L-iditol 2-dehydrogenase
MRRMFLLSKMGRKPLCDALLFLNGAYAQSIVIPKRIVDKNLLRLRADTPFADAALVNRSLAWCRE